MKKPLSAWVLSFVCCAVPLAAIAEPVPQNPPSGLLLGAPLGITSAGRGEVAVKTAGFDPGLPPNWPPNLPRPDFEHLVGQITPPAFAPHVPLLAMSLGIDVISVQEVALRATDFPDEPSMPAMDYPVLQVGTHGWYAILFSVESAQMGPVEELAPDVANAGDERDRSVFCYVLPTSTGELLPLEQHSVRVLRPQALGLTQLGDDIRALNMHMALYWTDLQRYPDVFTTQPLPQTPDVYFTLDVAEWPDARRNDLKNAWQVEAVGPDVVFKTRWNGSQWQTPGIYRRLAALNLKVMSNEAVDGLAIDTKGTEDDRDDELLVSLRKAPASSRAEQILHVAIASKDPRPVVVRRRDEDGYGSLGHEMRGGRAIGDFCTADPFVLRGRDITVSNADPLLDDFLVARRLPPDDPHLARVAGALQVRDWVGIERPQEPPFGSIPVPNPFPLPELSRDPLGPRLGRDALMLFPHGDGYVQLAYLDLSIAAFRIVKESRSHARCCMSWGRPRAANGTGFVRWGVIDNYTEPLVEGHNLFWQDRQPITWSGDPIVFDHLLPTDGALPPRSSDVAVVGASSPPHAARPSRRNAFVLQWCLVTGGRAWISPIAALRY